MGADVPPGIAKAVAPARERGLKSTINAKNLNTTAGRSREGAWIEIYSLPRRLPAASLSLPRGSVD